MYLGADSYFGGGEGDLKGTNGEVFDANY